MAGIGAAGEAWPADACRSAFPTAHLLPGRHGLLMNTYGREPCSLNNGQSSIPSREEPMNDADAARRKLCLMTTIERY
jgi:hypothetical protein